MKNIIICLFPLLVSLEASGSSYYIGSDYFKSDISIAGEKSDPTQTTFRTGVSLWPQVAFELQIGQTKSSDTLYRFEIEFEKSKALFFRFSSQEYDEITVDVSLGYSENSLLVNGPQDTYNSSETYQGFAWGVAANQRLRSFPNISFRISYQSLYDDDALHIRGYSAGFTFNF